MKNKAGPLALTAILYFTASGGAFGLEPLVSSVGPAVSLILLLAVPLLWSLPTVLMVAELSAALPVEGGYYRWVDRALGRFWGFQEAWWSWAAALPDMALYPVMFAAYLGQVVPLTPLERWLVALAVIWLSALLNLHGIRTVGATAVLSGAFLVAPFLIFSALCFSVPAALPSWSWSFSGKPADLLLGLSVVLWNYTGWDNISLVGAEVDRPARNYPLALGAGLALVVALYLLPVLAGLRVAPQPAAWQEGSFPVLARSLPGGNWLSLWLLAGALVSFFALFNSQLLSYSRLPLAVAQDGLLPARFAGINQGGVPVFAVVVSAALYSLFALFGFARLVVLDMLLYTLSLVLEFLALWRLRKNEPGLPRPFRIPGANFGLTLVVVPPLGVAAVVLAFVVWQGLATPFWLALSLGAAVAGAPLYWLLKKREQKA